MGGAGPDTNGWGPPWRSVAFEKNQFGAQPFVHGFCPFWANSTKKIGKSNKNL